MSQIENKQVQVENAKPSTKRKSKSKINLENDLDVNLDATITEAEAKVVKPKKERAPRVSMFDQVKSRLINFYGVTENQFLSYALKNKKKENVNQFAARLINSIFFDETLIEKIKKS